MTDLSPVLPTPRERPPLPSEEWLALLDRMMFTAQRPRRPEPPVIGRHIGWKLQRMTDLLLREGWPDVLRKVAEVNRR